MSNRAKCWATLPNVSGSVCAMSADPQVGDPPTRNATTRPPIPARIRRTLGQALTAYWHSESAWIRSQPEGVLSTDEKRRSQRTLERIKQARPWLEGADA